MPYIKQERQTALLLNGANPQDVGELNYLITVNVMSYFYGKDAINENNYATRNEIMGVFESAKQEFYRKVVVPYENDKCEENGEVY